MGMFDYVKCEFPLPEAPKHVQNEEFQTKAFGDDFTNGFMDHYTITKDGKLILHKTKHELVPEKERPYYGKPEWDENHLFKLMGSMRSVFIGNETIEYHGVIYICTIDKEKKWYEYEIKFTNGKVSDIKRINRKIGAE